MLHRQPSIEKITSADRLGADRSLDEILADVIAHVAAPATTASRRRALVDARSAREEHDVADRLAAGEEHREPVDAEADAAGRRHAVGERLDVVGVALLRLDVAGRALGLLEREPLRLLLRVVDLGERVAELDAAGEVLEALDDRRVVVGRARERRQLDRVVVEDRRLDRATARRSANARGRSASTRSDRATRRRRAPRAACAARPRRASRVPARRARRRTSRARHGAAKSISLALERRPSSCRAPRCAVRETSCSMRSIVSL